MDNETFSDYLNQAESISATIDVEKTPFMPILPLIEKLKGRTDQENDFHHFFQGEEAFFRGKFDTAIQQYLQAKSIPSYQFFCFRASAFASNERGDKEKALTFANKALTLKPTDRPTQRLLEKLLGKEPQAEEKTPSKIAPEAHPSPMKILNEGDVAELVNIFEASPDMDQPLFTELKKEPSTPATEPSITTEAEQTACEVIEKAPKSPAPKPLYAPSPAKQLTPPTRSSYDAQEAISQLKRLTAEEENVESTYTSSLSTKERENILAKQIREFEHHRTQLIKKYLNQSQRTGTSQEPALYFLESWHPGLGTRTSSSKFSLAQQTQLTFSPHHHRTSGGIFFRWEGIGIVINPSKHFLDHFHQHGLHLRDIHAVIVTQDTPQIREEIQEIYHLNYELNKVSDELQTIRYFLNQEAFQHLSGILKPNFKQEKNTIYCLEHFVDSPDVECVDIAEEISLQYFPASSKKTQDENLPLGIRLLLSSSRHPQKLSIGYVSGTAWSEALAQDLQSCDILIAGFGHTDSKDYEKLQYTSTCLGYHGILSLTEAVKPKLLILTEFEGDNGDIRLEAAKKLRQEFSTKKAKTDYLPAVLPADKNLMIDLKKQQILCNVTQTFVDPIQVRVVRVLPSYGSLHYISPATLL